MRRARRLHPRSARLGKTRSLEVREALPGAASQAGPSTNRRISENLGISQAAVKTGMIELRARAGARQAAIKQRIYEGDMSANMKAPYVRRDWTDEEGTSCGA